MKALVLFSLSLTVALGTPILPPGVELHPDVRGEDQSPLLGDLVPVQGHVVVENPAPPISLSSKELQEKTAPVETKAKLEVNREPEVKLEPEVKMEDEVRAEQEPEPVEAKVKIEPEMEKELQTEADFKVESEVKVDPEELHEVDRGTNPDKGIEEWHIDMERRYGPVMGLEPLDDDDMLKENHQETSEDEMFPMRDYVPGEKEEEEEDMVKEEEELLGKSDSILDVMEPESELMEETFQNHVVSDEAAMDEETGE